MTQLSALTHVGLGKEVTPGLAVVPTVFFPVAPPSVEDIPAYLVDESMDANATLVRGVYQGTKRSEIGFGGPLYPEAVGHLLVAAGMVDVISGAGPYVHTLKFPASGAQPPSFTFTDYNSFEARAYPGCKLDELALKIDVNGMVSYETKWVGYPSATAATPVPAFAATPPWLGWQNAVSIAAVASTRVIESEVAIKRNAEAIHTQAGTQSPREVFAGVIEASAKLKSIFESNLDWNHLIVNDQPALVLTLTQSAALVLALTMTKGAWVKSTLDRGGKYAALAAEITGVYSATDAGPVAAVLTDSRSTAY